MSVSIADEIFTHNERKTVKDEKEDSTYDTIMGLKEKGSVVNSLNLTIYRKQMLTSENRWKL
jgi:hypothetical protein